MKKFSALVYNGLGQFDFIDPDRSIEAHRNPIRAEIKRGYGAIHYKSFPKSIWSKPDGKFKKWIVCPIDGLRYYRGV
jgi:hypothetical protein